MALLNEGTALPADLLADIDAWCGVDHDAADTAIAAMMWAVAGNVAALTHRLALAGERTEMVRRLRSRLADGSVLRGWLDEALAGMDTVLVMVQDRSAGPAQLEELHRRQVAEGHTLAAFTTAAQLSVAYLALDRPDDSLRAGLGALEILSAYREALPGSSERQATRQAHETVYLTVLKAAARLPDPRVLAEVIEYLRAQEMPVVLHTPEPTQLPLAALMPASGLRRPQPTADVPDAVVLGRPRPVLMPWGQVALSGWIEPSAGTPVPLVVPRAGTPQRRRDAFRS